MKKSLLFLLLALFTFVPQLLWADGDPASVVMGYCEETPYTGMSMGARQEAIVAVRFDEDFVSRYAGCKVTSIRVCMSGVIGATAGVFLFPDSQRPENIPHTTDPNSAAADDYYKAAQNKPEEFAFHFPNEEWIKLPGRTDVAGQDKMMWQWVEVPLSKPYIIDRNDAFYAGFRCFPPIGGVSNSVIALAGGGTDEHSWVYFPDSDNWTKWCQLLETNMAEYGVNLMIQVRVEGDNLPTNDIAMAAINGSDFLKMGEDYRYECVIQNMATNTIKSFDLSYSIDGVEVVKDKHMEFQNGLKNKEYGGFVVEGINFSEPGMHHVEMTVSNPNGVEDTNPKDNTLVKYVNVYDPANAVERRVLVESFSTASCGNCPAAHEREAEGLADTDAIIVVHHSGFYTDPLTTDADVEYTWFYNMGGSTFAPAIMMDRTDVNSFYDTGYPGPVFLPGAPEDIHSIHNAVKDIPTTVGVDIAGQFNPESRELSIDVSGTVLAFPVGSDHRLNVWIVEDGVKIKQPQSGSAEGVNYIHNHVFRETLTGIWGEQINLKGTSYSKNYTFTVPAGWNADNIKVVAFLSNITIDNPKDCKVFNAQEISINNLIPTSIAATTSGTPTTNTYYNLAGQRTSANAEGVSIRSSVMPSGEVVVRKTVK